MTRALLNATSASAASLNATSGPLTAFICSITLSREREGEEREGGEGGEKERRERRGSETEREREREEGKGKEKTEWVIVCEDHKNKCTFAHTKLQFLDGLFHFSL